MDYPMEYTRRKANPSALLELSSKLLRTFHNQSCAQWQFIGGLNVNTGGVAIQGISENATNHFSTRRAGHNTFIKTAVNFSLTELIVLEVIKQLWPKYFTKTSRNMTEQERWHTRRQYISQAGVKCYEDFKQKRINHTWRNEGRQVWLVGLDYGPTTGRGGQEDGSGRFQELKCLFCKG